MNIKAIAVLLVTFIIFSCGMSYSATLSKPVLYNPANAAEDISTSSQNFSWSSVTGATVYRIVVLEDGHYTDFVDEDGDSYCKNTTTCFTETTSSTSYSGFTLKEGTKYFWIVRAGSPDIPASEFSAAYFITKTTFVENKPPTLVKESATPSSITSGEQITFESTWDDPENKYIVDVQVRYRRQGTTSWQTKTLSFVSGYTFKGTYTISGSEGTYEYQFRASDADTASGTRTNTTSWSSTSNFTVTGASQLNKPVLTRPAGDALNVSATTQNFDWNSVSGATKYRILVLEYGHTGDMVNDGMNSYCKNSDTCFTATSTSSSYSGFTLKEGTKYYWLVWAGSSDGSEDSEPGTDIFTTGTSAIENKPPVLVSSSATPNSITSGEQVTFESIWDDPENKYVVDVQVRFRKQGTTSWQTETLSFISGYTFRGSSTISGSEGTYEYQFRASDADTPSGMATNTTNWLSGGTFQVVEEPTTAEVDKASLYSENYEDNTVLAGNKTFTKTWTLKNIGTTTWDSNYKLSYLSGVLSTDKQAVAISGTVAPNEMFTFSVPMKAPATQEADQVYSDYWKFINSDGNTVSVSGSSKIWARIKVAGTGGSQNASDLQRIASALFDISLNQIDSASGAYYTYNLWGSKPPEYYTETKCNGYKGGHSGIDMQTKDVAGANTADRNFYAVSAGKVIKAGGDKYNTIAVYDEEQDITVLYLHARKVSVALQSTVVAGTTLLGVQGDTAIPGAEHVHIEVRKGYKTGPACGAVDTPNPVPYLIAYLNNMAPEDECKKITVPKIGSATASMEKYYNNGNGVIDSLDPNVIETRESFAHILVGAIEKYFYRELRPVDDSVFSDMNYSSLQSDSVLKLEALLRNNPHYDLDNNPVNTVYVISRNIDLLSGDAKFNPKKTISRREALYFLVRVYEYFSRKEVDIKGSEQAFLDIAEKNFDCDTAEESGCADYKNTQKGFYKELTSGYSVSSGRCFVPDNHVPRHEAVGFINKLINALNNLDEEDADDLSRINIFLEMEAMEGVEFNGTDNWPSFKAKAPGDDSERSLHEIYSEVGIDLTVEQVKFDDPRGTRAGEPFTYDELHQLMTQVADTPQNHGDAWHIRCFFLPSDVNRNLGIMFENPGRGFEGRDGFAVFIDEINGMDLERYNMTLLNQAYLRTTAHELGHALNLLHQDGDGTTTIMNKTGYIKEDWEYEWNTKSLNHFYSHPLERIEPETDYEFKDCHDKDETGSLEPKLIDWSL